MCEGEVCWALFTFSTKTQLSYIIFKKVIKYFVYPETYYPNSGLKQTIFDIYDAACILHICSWNHYDNAMVLTKQETWRSNTSGRQINAQNYIGA